MESVSKVLVISSNADYDIELAKGYEERIGQCLDEVKTRFVQIGLNLMEAEQRKIYEVFGYKSLADYAFEKFDFSATATRNFIAVYKRFGERATIKQRYTDYTYSQLVEMSSMSSVVLQLVKPEMTVQAIRELKKQYCSRDEAYRIASSKLTKTSCRSGGGVCTMQGWHNGVSKTYFQAERVDGELYRIVTDIRSELDKDIASQSFPTKNPTSDFVNSCSNAVLDNQITVEEALKDSAPAHIEPSPAPVAHAAEYTYTVSEPTPALSHTPTVRESVSDEDYSSCDEVDDEHIATTEIAEMNVAAYISAAKVFKSELQDIYEVMHDSPSMFSDFHPSTTEPGYYELSVDKFLFDNYRKQLVKAVKVLKEILSVL